MKLSQKQIILNHLQQGNSLTQAEAILLCHCYRLSAVIERLRKDGYYIVTHDEPNTYSMGTHARYELKVVA